MRFDDHFFWIFVIVGCFGAPILSLLQFLELGAGVLSCSLDLCLAGFDSILETSRKCLEPLMDLVFRTH